MQPVHVLEPPSGLDRVTLIGPVVAVALTVRVAVTWVELTNVVELTVNPVPARDAARPLPLANPVPVSVTTWLASPSASELGLIELITGAASIVNALLAVAAVASVLVIVMFRAPVAAPDA